MTRSLVIALAGFVLVAFVDWRIDYQVEKYQPQRNPQNYYEALFGGAVFSGLRENAVYLWDWIGGNHDALLVLFTFLLFCVTAFLVRYTAKLWGATDDLVTDARDSAERELRAYIFIKSASIVNTGTGQQPRPGFTITNYGTTPAHKMVILVGYCFGKSFVETEYGPIEQRGTLGPTADIHYYNICPRALTPDETVALQRETHFLFVYGEIRYVDFTGETRTTKFRLKAMKNVETGLIGPQLEVCKDGNDAD